MNGEARNIFIKNLKRIMNQRNLRQVDIAKKTNTPLSTVNGWVNGKSYPRVDKMQELADVLDVSMVLLTDDVEEKMQKFYSSATPQQKANMQRKTLEDVKGWFDENTYNLLENYLDCDDKGKQLANDRITELVKLYPKDK